MKRILYLILLTILLLTGYSINGVAEGELMLTPLSTFFNEDVSGSYTVSGNAAAVIPVDVAAQGNLNIKIEYENLKTDYLMKIYTDDSYINLIHSTLLSSVNNSHTASITAGGKTTLYLHIAPAMNNVQAEPVTFNITAGLHKAKTQTISNNKTLKNKSWTKKKMVKSKSKHYYKLKIKGSKYLNISSNNTYINVQLFDSTKKKALSAAVPLKSSNNFHSSFALSKGTYYVLVTADYQTSYQIYYQCKNVPIVYGKKINKAKKLYFNKQTLGLLTATDGVSSGQYYKFRFNSDKKIQLAFYVENSSDQFNLQLYDSDYNELPTSNYKLGNASLLYINSRAAMPAGLYYIKITKTKAATSGCYSIMVRNQ